MFRCPRNRVRAVPVVSFNDLVGAGEERMRNGKAKRVRSREVDHKLNFGRLLDRKFAGLGSAQNLIDVVCCASEPLNVAGSVRYECPSLYKIASTENRREPGGE